jgi:hypothetical protein
MIIEGDTSIPEGLTNVSAVIMPSLSDDDKQATYFWHFIANNSLTLCWTTVNLASSTSNLRGVRFTFSISDTNELKKICKVFWRETYYSGERRHLRLAQGQLRRSFEPVLPNEF